MILKIQNKEVKLYNQFSVHLKYDTVASTFSFNYYFNPDNADFRALLRPGKYPSVKVEHNGERLITGTLLNYQFASEASRQLTAVSGYAKAGVLEDCQIPPSLYPLQSDGLTLKEITQKLIQPFGINLIVDSSVVDKVNASYETATANASESIKSYLSELASQRHVILTHNEYGDLVMTEAKAQKAAIFDFVKGMPGVKMKLEFNGQKMHSEISVQRQAKKDDPNGESSSIKNPYAAGTFRPRVEKQSTGDEMNTPLATRNALSEELKEIKLLIELEGWTLNDKIVRPNNIITVLNPDLFLFKKTNFFIESVEYSGDNESESAVLTCVVPEVYNNQTPNNIFL